MIENDASRSARADMLDTTAPVLIGILLAAAQSLGGASYSLKDLGRLTDLAGRDESKPNAINFTGRIAAANVTNGAYRALLYGGTWTNLGTLGGTESLASGVNDSNRVAGHSLTAGGETRAFLWTPGGTDGVASNPQMKALGTLGGGTSEAYDINGSGQITGYAQTLSNERAFRYSGGVMTDIGSLLGNGLPNSYGYAINDAGHVAGVAYNRNYSAPHAFFYNGTTTVDIGSLGGNGSTALSINNADHIVGYLSTTNDHNHAFHYFAGVMTDLGTLGGHYGYAISINDSNVIVGGSFIDGADTIYHAFLHDGTSMLDLNSQLDASGAGWVLLEARAINDAGQIVGVGTFGGVTRAFLLNPAPRITGVEARGHDVLVRFTTIHGGNYSLVSRQEVAGGSWSNVVTNVAGNGTVVTATNTGVLTQPRRFYRARRDSP